MYSVALISNEVSGHGKPVEVDIGGLLCEYIRHGTNRHRNSTSKLFTV